MGDPITDEDFITKEQVLNKVYTDTLNFLRMGIVDFDTTVGMLQEISGRHYSDTTTAVTFAAGPVEDFGFKSHSFSLENDGFNRIRYSFDGTNIHGSVRVGGIVNKDFIYESAMYLESDDDGGDRYILEVW